MDLRKGKADDDGYRGIHLYYKQDNFHYVIEVQLWADPDYAFNIRHIQILISMRTLRLHWSYVSYMIVGL